MREIHLLPLLSPPSLEPFICASPCAGGKGSGRSRADPFMFPAASSRSSGFFHPRGQDRNESGVPAGFTDAVDAPHPVSPRPDDTYRDSTRSCPAEGGGSSKGPSPSFLLLSGT